MENLEVKPSTIKGAGNGLFTKGNIKSGSIILKCFDFFSSTNNEKLFSKCFFQTNEGGRLNHSKTANCIAVYNFKNKSIYNMATRDIPAGGEIVADYQQLIDLVISL